jgi:antitoxin component YwqK of YwqJK toxin-antitoxin module
MKKFCFSILFIFYTFLCRAQDTTIYFNEKWEMVCCKDSASFYRIGIYDHGIYDGPVSDYFITGQLQMKGEYSSWMKNGVFTWYYKNGKKMCTGIFQNGDFTMMNGWDSHGNKVVVNGDGNFTWYLGFNMHPSDIGAYKGGKKNGIWQNYSFDGAKIIEEVSYDKGIPLMIDAWDDQGKQKIVSQGNGKYIRYFKNGKIKCIGNFSEGKGEGEWVRYFENGNVESKMNFKNGNLTGTSTYYYDHGLKKKEMNFLDGTLHGSITWWYTNGNIYRSGFYKNGEKVGKWDFYLGDGNLIASDDYGNGF